MSDKRRRAGGQAPLSAHPAFPAIVALWFAGLLGIGTLVLPVTLIERVTEASGLPAYLAAAHAPLGTTARIAIALVAGIGGILAGLAVAHVVARPHRARPAARQDRADFLSDEPVAPAVKRPISAHDELFEGGLDAYAENLRENEAEPFHREDDFDLAVETPTYAGFESLDADADGTVTAGPLDLGMFDEGETQRRQGARDLERPGHFEGTDGELSGTAESVVPVAERESDVPAHALETDSGSPDAVIAAGESSEVFRAPEVEAAHSRPAPDVAIVDLVDRFARALERHRVAAREPEAAPIEALAPTGAEDDVAVSPRIPQAMREIDFDADGFGDDHEFGDEFEDDGPHENYPSLLAMKGSYGHQREPVRIVDDASAGEGSDGREMDGATEAVLDFPTRVPSGRDAEGALRDALERLQRLSGAA